ncbi:hypothetical protein ACE193_00485 [Bernardetia sp. OM2101]|uniref:hypothetical protein n=1 Tax=Bernardetia sp. OM2101 TaxID=3344876 RepID=UPI0035D09A05
MKPRVKESYQKFLSDFIKFDILVDCPNCSKKAIVKPDNFLIGNVEQKNAKIICLSCGHNKKLIDKPCYSLYSPNNNMTMRRGYIISGAIDPFFFLPLWLKTEFDGHILWAYNSEHLEFLGRHIEAKLRERNGQELSNRSLGSRLPKWMTSKKNREALLKKLDELKSK